MLLNQTWESQEWKKWLPTNGALDCEINYYCE